MTLEIVNGTFAYDKTRTVLDRINMRAESGDLIAILGPNGAGKTTLLRTMMDFLHWQSGESLLDGVDIRKIPQKQLWQKIAYVPQAKSVVSSYTCREMLLLGRASHLSAFSKPAPADIERVECIAEKLHVSGLLDKKCSQISGGELQMVLIGRALAAEPTVLILDEPESNLDFKNQLIVLETMTELAASGMTCIFNTHYPAHALQRANKSLILCRDGSYIFGRTAEIVTEQNIERAFGVKAVIGEIETDTTMLRNVVPVRVTSVGDGTLSDSGDSTQSDESVIAVVSVILKDFESAHRVNELLHEYNQYLIGRMGLPYKKDSLSVHIINLTLEAPKVEIVNLCDELKRLPGISLKATYAE